MTASIPPRETPDDDAGTWQFSLRSLLILATFVSVLLAIGVHFGGMVVALAIVGLSQAGMLLCGDWLIRRENRHALAFVTAAAWAVLGSAFVIGALASMKDDLIGRVGLPGSALPLSFAVSLCGAGILSYYIAIRRWQQLRPRNSLH